MFFFHLGSKAGSPVAETKEYGYRNTCPDSSKKWSLAGFVLAILTTFYATGPASVLVHCTGGNMYLWDTEQ